MCYRILARNKDTGLTWTVTRVYSSAEAQQVIQEHQSRFPNDHVWKKRMLRMEERNDHAED